LSEPVDIERVKEFVSAVRGFLILC